MGADPIAAYFSANSSASSFPPLWGEGYDLRINHIGRRDGREKGVKGVRPRDK